MYFVDRSIFFILSGDFVNQTVTKCNFQRNGRQFFIRFDKKKSLTWNFPICNLMKYFLFGCRKCNDVLLYKRWWSICLCRSLARKSLYLYIAAGTCAGACASSAALLCAQIAQWFASFMWWSTRVNISFSLVDSEHTLTQLETISISISFTLSGWCLRTNDSMCSKCKSTRLDGI